MEKRTIKTICGSSVLTAVYVVLSAFLKINLIGNIQLDLGYLAFTVGLCLYGPTGVLVGMFGCAIESLLFSAYGFSVSWFTANAIIGIACGFVFLISNKTIIRAVAIVVSCAVGMLAAKTIIECWLYQIPLAVKLPKNAVAFGIDAALMIAGLFLFQLLDRRSHLTRKIGTISDTVQEVEE